MIALPSLEKIILHTRALACHNYETLDHIPSSRVHMYIVTGKGSSI
jgi:hypothetical protein